MNMLKIGLVFLAVSASFPACVVVKVKKNPRDVDTSRLASTDRNFSLNNPAEFLKSAMVREALIKLVAENKDQWVRSFRWGLRYYRAALIAQAYRGVGIDDSMYRFEECQSFDLLKFKKQYQIVQMIAHTALFAGLAEIGHRELPADLKSDENVKATFELIKAELGVKIEKISDRDGYIGLSLRLAAIDGEEGVDDALRAADEAQALRLYVKRDVKADQTGSIAIRAEIDTASEGSNTKPVVGMFNISRSKAPDETHIIAVDASFGLLGENPKFVRKIVISQIKGEDNKVKIFDYVRPGQDPIVTTISLVGSEVKWCKIQDDTTPPVVPCATLTKTSDVSESSCIGPAPSVQPTPTPVGGGGKPTPTPSGAGGNNPGQNNNPGQSSGK